MPEIDEDDVRQREHSFFKAVIIARIRISLWSMVLICMGSCSTNSAVAGQEIFALGGWVSSSGKSAPTWQLSYKEEFSEHFAYSISWLNEGHLAGHHRDGPTCQIWGQTRLMNDTLTFSTGLGPYLFFDTQQSGGPQYKDIHRSWAGIGSLSATWRAKGAWRVQLRGNYVMAHSDINTASILLGIGYDFNPSAPLNASHSTITDPDDSTYEEIAVLLGGMTINGSKKSQTSMAASIEYRREILSFLEWTVGWLHEGNTEWFRRSGLTTQVWPTKSLFDRRLRIGLGLGVYVALNTRYSSVTCEDDDEILLGIITPTISYQFTEKWAVRLSWNRTVSGCNLDTDVILAGIGYAF